MISTAATATATTRAAFVYLLFGAGYCWHCCHYQHRDKPKSDTTAAQSHTLFKCLFVRHRLASDFRTLADIDSKSSASVIVSMRVLLFPSIR